MSYDAVSWAVCASGAMTATERHVLTLLGHHANEHGICWPSVELLTAESCLSHRSIYLALSGLRGLGKLTVTRRQNGGNQYHLPLDEILRHAGMRATGNGSADSAANLAGDAAGAAGARKTGNRGNRGNSASTPPKSGAEPPGPAAASNSGEGDQPANLAGAPGADAPANPAGDDLQPLQVAPANLAGGIIIEDTGELSHDDTARGREAGDLLPDQAGTKRPRPKRGATLTERGHRLPDDWQPNGEDRAFAVGLGVDPDKLLAEFRDYWHSVPGAKGRKLDWSATYRNRCRDKQGDRRYALAPGAKRPEQPDMLGQKPTASAAKPGSSEWARQQREARRAKARAQQGEGDGAPPTTGPIIEGTAEVVA